jgi:hypothetical protein
LVLRPSWLLSPAEARQLTEAVLQRLVTVAQLLLQYFINLFYSTTPPLYNLGTTRNNNKMSRYVCACNLLPSLQATHTLRSGDRRELFELGPSLLRRDVSLHLPLERILTSTTNTSTHSFHTHLIAAHCILTDCEKNQEEATWPLRRADQAQAATRAAQEAARQHASYERRSPPIAPLFTDPHQPPCPTTKPPRTSTSPT